MEWIIIYAIGCIASFILLRIADKSMYPDSTWGDIIFFAVLSLFSWVGVATAIIGLCIIALSKIKSKPPTWL